MNKKITIVFAVFAIMFLVGCGGNDTTEEQVTAQPDTEDSNVDENNGVPEGCVTWFDGCNTCSVNTQDPSGPMACTMMACPVRQEPYCMKYEDGSSDAPQEVFIDEDLKQGIENATYNIEGQEITLVDGKSEIEAAPGSATKIITQTTFDMAEGDLQQGTGDTLDGAVILMQDLGGSGTFYYLGATIEQVDSTYVAASNTYLLGDRIEVTELKIEDRQIHVTYLDRKDDEPMSAEPTVEVKKQYSTKGTDPANLVLMDVTSSEPVTTDNEEKLIGGDEDEHGCKGSAGYTWDEEKEKCVRSWEAE